MGEPASERDDPGRDEGRAELSSRYFAWSQATQIPHCMIAVSLDLIWGNAAAMRMLKAGEDFQIVNGMLCCADKADTASLRQFIAGLDNGVAAWACRRRDEEGFRVIRAERFTPVGLPPFFGLAFQRASKGGPEIWADMKRVMDITPAEERVIQRLALGEVVEEVAGELSVSVETVRTHVRRIYAKLQISSREQLLALVGQFRVF